MRTGDMIGRRIGHKGVLLPTTHFWSISITSHIALNGQEQRCCDGHMNVLSLSTAFSSLR